MNGLLKTKTYIKHFCIPGNREGCCLAEDKKRQDDESMAEDMAEEFTAEEKKLLAPFVSNIDRPVFVLKNLPEVIKGALFSRYSRSAKGLRRLLLDEFISNPELGIKQITRIETEDDFDEVLAIQKAKDFYDRILDGFGDDSIGELGGAHVAFENVSNMASKVLEDARIGGSPLEKSTRYVFFDKKVNNDFLFFKEPVIMKSNLAELYLETNRFLFETYAKLVEPMKKFFMEKIPKQEGVSDIAYKFSIRAKACDSIRGLLPASTLTNLGIFGNGRFFDSLLLRLRTHDLKEMHIIADNMHAELNKAIPSFVRKAMPSHRHFPGFHGFLKESRLGVAKLAQQVAEKEDVEKSETVTLLDYDKDAELKVISAMMYAHTRLPLQQIRNIVGKMDDEEKKKLLHEALYRRKNKKHKPPRAFEHAYYTFDILGDFGMYRDLHRHRILTQERQDLTVAHGYDVPPEIIDAGFESEFKEVMKKAADAYEQIYRKFPKQAQYVVPFQYKIRWYNKLSLREIYWLAELRSGAQGHPNYRFVAQEMYRKVKEVHPLLAEYMKFVDMKDYSLGRLSAEIEKVKKKGLDEK